MMPQLLKGRRMGLQLVVHLSPPVTNAWGVLLEGGYAMCRVPIGGEANR